MGADNALLAFVITIGSRIPLAINKISCINASPCEDVAVYVRKPLADAPTQAEIAECSDSAYIIFAFNFPSATICDKFSGMCVCGVIGYIVSTAGLHNTTTSATTSEPSRMVFTFKNFRKKFYQIYL